MKVRSDRLRPSVVRAIVSAYAAALVAIATSTALAAGVVGSGTADSCTDAALNTALADGGMVTFDCGPDPVTIDISTGTGTKTIDNDTTIDGGGLITVSGGNTMNVFYVPPLYGVAPLNFTVENLTIASGVDYDDRTYSIANAGTLTVANSTFTGHATGIANVGTLTVTNSTFTGNSTGIGNGVGPVISNPATVTVTNSSFTGNGRGVGGSGGITVTNSTFTGNSEIGVVAYGMLTVTNSTFTGNGGGAVSVGATPECGVDRCIFFRGYASLRNTIFANNTGGNCSVFDGNITDGGHNLDDGTSCGFSTANGSLSDTDPQLDPAGLQDNGGRTETVALCTAANAPAGCTVASPAIDAGDPSVCAAVPVNDLDQRGFVRPSAQCSIGAYEADATAPEPCVGDCNGSSLVTINELVSGVNMLLSDAPLDQCQAFDCNGTGYVTVDCLVQAVNSVLYGCGVVCSSAGVCDGTPGSG